jgi:hypothetical protein
LLKFMKILVWWYYYSLYIYRLAIMPVRCNGIRCYLSRRHSSWSCRHPTTFRLHCHPYRTTTLSSSLRPCLPWMRHHSYRAHATPNLTRCRSCLPTSLSSTLSTSSFSSSWPHCCTSPTPTSHVVVFPDHTVILPPLHLPDIVIIHVASMPA